MGSLAPKTTHPQPAWATVLAQGVDEAKERRREKTEKTSPMHKRDEGRLEICVLSLGILQMSCVYT